MQPLSNKVPERDAEWLLRDKYNGIKNTQYKKDLERLACGEPLGYVIGWVPFLGLRINLASRPLIPRNETEWWVSELIQKLRIQYEDKPFSLLDIGAGSGAIGCAILAQIPNVFVSFVEINPAHSKTILGNVLGNKLDISRTNIKSGDLFTPFGNTKFDVIVSNPPYIPKDRQLPQSVTNYEPHEALYSGKDGLDIIRAIANSLATHLSKNGTAWIEIDAPHAQIAQKLFIEKNFSTKIIHDQYGRPRVIVAYY